MRKLALIALVHAGLEVAVAGEHARGDEIVLRHHVFDAGVQRSRVADAGGAAVADELEAELVEIGLEPGLVEIVRHDARARRERGLDARRDRETPLDRFLREQSGGQHDARVRRVRAGRDRRDDHVAVPDLDTPGRAPGRTADRSGVGRLFAISASVQTFVSRASAPLTLGGLLAAAARLDRAAQGRDEALGKRRLRACRTRSRRRASRRDPGSGIFMSGRSMRSCGRFGPATLGAHPAEVELEDLGVVAVARARHAEEALRLVVAPERRRPAPTVRPVARRYLQDSSSTGKKPIVAPYSGAMFAIVARSVTGRDAAPSPKNSTNLPTTLALRSISVTDEDEIGRGDAVGEPAVQVHADDIRREEVDRLAEHAGLGLDSARRPSRRRRGR